MCYRRSALYVSSIPITYTPGRPPRPLVGLVYLISEYRSSIKNSGCVYSRNFGAFSPLELLLQITEEQKTSISKLALHSAFYIGGGGSLSSKESS